ncbi:MAG: metal-dependent hydrolase [Planctomycetota bacterium JB042]
MDNLTHSLLALTLARTRLGRASPLATPALVVAANFPDLDVVVRAFGGSPAYLAYHRGITHAVLGVLVQVVVLTWLWHVLERIVRKDDASPHAFGRGGPFLPVAAGLLTHPLLDLLNNYGLRPWLPFDGAWIYGDLVFVVDPWMWLLLGGAAALAGGRRVAGDVGWSIVAVATTLLVFGVDEPRTPLALRVVWIPAVLTIAVLRARAALVGREGALLRTVAAVAAVYLAGLGLLRARAERLALAEVTPRLYADESIVTLVRSPRVADPRRWTIIVETEGRVLWEEIDVVEGRIDGREAAKGTDDPRVALAAATAAGEKWRTFARVPLARVSAEGGREVVRLTDARYWFTDWCTVTVPLPPAKR